MLIDVAKFLLQICCILCPCFHCILYPCFHFILCPCIHNSTSLSLRGYRGPQYYEPFLIMHRKERWCGSIGGSADPRTLQELSDGGSFLFRRRIVLWP